MVENSAYGVTVRQNNPLYEMRSLSDRHHLLLLLLADIHTTRGV